MSIYVMTVGDLAKKRGEPVGEFVRKVQDLGFDAGSHAKKLTQKDLDNLIVLLNSNELKNVLPNSSLDANSVEIKVSNPNVLMIHLPNGRINVVYVDAHINDVGEIELNVIENSSEPTLGEALLEFRKQMGLKMGIN